MLWCRAFYSPWIPPCVLFIFVAVSLLGQPANGFADNLIVTRVGCMTELDTSEVIMNNVVVGPDESDFPKMHLVVVLEDDNHIESPYHYHKSELSIAFVNPYSPSEFNDDIQFVMEVVEGDAEFIHGGTIGCDGNKRVSARFKDYNGEVTLQLHDTSASYKVLAGWATGHSAVKLTPPLVLEPDAKSGGKEPNVTNDELEIITDLLIDPKDDTENNKKEKPVKELKAQKQKAEKEKTDDTDMHKEEERKLAHKKEKEVKRVKKEKAKGDDLKNMKEKIKKELLGLQRQKKRPDDSSVVSAADHTDGGTTPEKAERVELKKKSNTIKNFKDRVLEDERKEGKRRKKLEEEMNRNFAPRSFRGRYHSDNFANKLHMSSFYYACVFFILSIGSIFYSFTKRRDKGRRDL